MTAPEPAAPEIRHNRAEHRYEAWLGDRLLGHILYQREPGRTVFLHTEVAAEAEGRGIGSRLARGALADVRASDQQVVAVCPFIARYVGTHPEFQDLLWHADG